MSACVDRLKWEKWEKWAKAIEDDLAIVVDDRNDFDAFRKVVDGNLDWILTHDGGSFLDFVRRGQLPS